MPRLKQITIGNTNYELIKTIGNGGSGVVWKAQSNENEYAVKFINSNDANKIARFRNEIEFCRTGNHKNIIKLIADGEQNGKPCYIMPLYPQTLKDLIDTEKDADVLISFILKLCDALKHIHNKRIFHRDIKPENILIANKDLVLADFGIAHFKDFNLTQKADLLANRNYAAPEQKEKNNANNITEAVDIFALGLIINECFTKQNPSGSDFKLIADSHPLYADLDNLVTNMIKQNSDDRLNIDSVITEIKFIHHKIKQSLEDIATVLKDQTELPNIKKPVLRTIIRRASEDILFGKILFSSKSGEELNKYNHNWHMKIGYTVDDFLFNLYVQEQIHTLCKGKFEYESNVYRRNNWNEALDLENNEEHKSLYEQINDIMAKYKLEVNGERLFDLSGEILKYFSACADYHCKEILKSIKQEEDLANTNLKNAPIIWIVQTLKSGLRQNIEYLLNGIDGLAGRYSFNFTEHIAISPERTETYFDNDDDTELLDGHYKEKETQIQKILSELQKKWKVICNRLDEDDYCIKFKSYKQYEKFRKYALELSSPYYIFEGDVMHILEYANFVGNMVELKLGRIFDIPNTIAKIVGLRKIDE
jgi:serine/threonine protein kinase